MTGSFAADAPKAEHIRGFHSPKLQHLLAARKRLRKLRPGMMSQLELANLSGHKDARSLRIIRFARRGRVSLLSGNEAFLLHSLARAQTAVSMA